MAFNGYKLNYPVSKILQVDDKQEANSVLSDDQSSWVIFDPESDILSYTNTNSNSQEYSGSENESLKSQVQFTQRYDYPKSGEGDETDQESNEDNKEERPSASQPELQEESDTEDLIDNLPSNITRPKSYNRINQWKMNNDFIDDNTASWDLDENLSNMALDTSILKLQSFYGDELIRNLLNEDYKKFTDIKLSLSRYLNRKRNPLRDQMLMKVLPLSEQVMLRNINYKNDMFNYHKRLIPEDEYSDTASLSLIICGGEGWSEV